MTFEDFKLKENHVLLAFNKILQFFYLFCLSLAKLGLLKPLTESLIFGFLDIELLLANPVKEFQLQISLSFFF